MMNILSYYFEPIFPEDKIRENGMHITYFYICHDICPGFNNAISVLYPIYKGKFKHINNKIYNSIHYSKPEKSICIMKITTLAPDWVG